MIASLGAPSKWDIDAFRWRNELPNVGMGAFLGATGLAPLTDPSGNPVFAGGPGSNGAQLYEDNTGTIVDINGNSSDPLTGEAYNYEIEGLYTAIPPATPVGVLAPPAPSSSVAQVPSGSTLTYSAKWNATFGLVGPQHVIADLTSQLSSHGMSVSGAQILSGGSTIGLTGGSIQVGIFDSIGHALLSDAQSVLDSIVMNAVGSSNWGGSSLLINTTPGQTSNPLTPSGAPPPSAPSSVSNFFSRLFSPSPSTPSSGTSPWVWLAIAGVGLIVVGVAVKK
jgi:hypothetical protein